MNLDLLQTLAVAALVVAIGEWLCVRIGVLARFSLPPPVVGGLLAAGLITTGAASSGLEWTFDKTLQQPLLIAFFATIGFGARLELLRRGGVQVALFLAACTLVAVLQSGLGMLVAAWFDQPPLFGVLIGVVTLSGGPATGAAFAPLFESAGVEGAGAIAVASAMSGIVLGGLLGGPIAAHWIRRRHLLPGTTGSEVGATLEAGGLELASDESASPSRVLASVLVLLMVVGAGTAVSTFIGRLGITLPGYIGAMLLAAMVCNLVPRLSQRRLWCSRTLDQIGNVALSLFLAMWLMTLDLRQLAGVALPLMVNLVLQAVLLVGVFGIVWRMMGRDYDAAVMGGGFIGFMLGTTATALAVMRTLAARFGVAPRAFLVAPLVGAFFIDFTNALLITGFLNLLA